MMYEHIVASLREAYGSKDVSDIKEHVAIQFNIWGEGHGALYMEIADGQIHIEPYEYVVSGLRPAEQIDLFAEDFVSFFAMEDNVSIVPLSDIFCA